MKNGLIGLFALIAIAGCSSKTPQPIDLSPKATLAAAPIVKDRSIELTVNDLRTAQYIALNDTGEKFVYPLHAQQNLRSTFSDLLILQLKSQGFKIQPNAPLTLQVDILDMVANVKNETVTNTIKSRVKVQLIAQAEGHQFTKRYSGESSETSGGSASEEDISEKVSQLLSLVLSDIAKDNELQQFLIKQ
ncbi:YajG family lipoprotein [Vibrio sp. SS-MA-C1-2]|uniref:YajG family lipoprotein n=1 Tax=Vibrio sp. SS-MA-C1-2 TaxID=2908646 RepID=UPI001F307DAB|nr:YajG family lipoprotein [Vibrio sp. SS-MA-C1-2]UJF18843.1 YajG family lipoprotein [Vibrio sp. SS-MA-C1-2]